MDFLSLPVEIGSKIFDYLDTKSQINLYNSCPELRAYLVTWCHPKRVVLSRSTLATVKTLEEKLLTDLGEHILELDLSGVRDLTVYNLKPHMKRLINLKALDITFTEIHLEDNILEICPQSLKSIGLDYMKFSYLRSENVSKYDKYKEVFKERQFETIHFVITRSLRISPFNLLKDVTTVKNLKLTISDCSCHVISSDFHSDVVDNQIEVNFNKLTLDCVIENNYPTQLAGVTRLNFKQLEYIFIRRIMFTEIIEIYVSPLLAKLFSVNCSKVTVEVSAYLPLNMKFYGNIVFKAWNKETTSFDEDFFKRLLAELKDYFPTYICMHNNSKMNIIDSPNSWYCIHECENFEEIQNIPSKVTLTDYCRHEDVYDRDNERCRLPIGLSKSSKALQHLSFLAITNIPIESMFFALLFEQCPKLTTLNIHAEHIEMLQSYTRSLSQSIHLSKMKNFMLSTKDINNEEVFGILSNCASLENVHIREYDRKIDENNRIRKINNSAERTGLVFIEKCVNLYSLFVETCIVKEDMAMMYTAMRTKAETLERDYLYIDVCEGWVMWDVFNPSPLHIYFE